MSAARRFVERLGDRLSALIWAIQRCDRFCDPVLTYADELSARLTARSDRFQAAIEATKRNLQNEIDRFNQLREREIVKLDKDILDATAELKIDEERFAHIRQEADPKLLKARDEFEQWKRAVGRPPYFEEFEALFKHKSLSTSQQHPDLSADDPKIDRQVNPQTFLSGSLRHVKNLLLLIVAAFPVAAVPADIFFTYPSFDFLLTNHPAAAWAAAALFTVALAVLGEGIGIFFLRSFRHDLEPPVTGVIVRTEFHIVSAVVFVLLSAGAIVTADVGATLRALVPKVNEYNTKKANLAAEENRLPRAPIFERDPYETQRAGFPGRKNALEKDRADLVEKYQPFWKSIDGQVAFAIYMILAFSVAVRRITSHDPIFEYGLHARQHSELARAYLRDMLKAAQTINRTRAKLNSLEKQRSILERVPADHSSEIKKQATLINKIQNRIGELEARLRRLSGGNSQLWIRSRARRFGKYYILFRMGLPEHVRNTISRHLAGAQFARTDSYLYQEAT